MTYHPIALTLGTVIMLSSGQIMFKLAANRINISEYGIIKSFFLNPLLILALIIYAIASISWLLVLRTTPLKIAYPFIALSFVIVPLLSYYFLNESLSWKTILGALLIIIGIAVSILK